MQLGIQLIMYVSIVCATVHVYLSLLLRIYVRTPIRMYSSMLVCTCVCVGGCVPTANANS